MHVLFLFKKGQKKKIVLQLHNVSKIEDYDLIIAIRVVKQQEVLILEKFIEIRRNP